MSAKRKPSGKAVDPLLHDGAGHAALLLGNEAIVRGALEAGVAFASGYPGTPASEVIDSFARLAKRLGIAFEYSVNEKVALEMAFAASLAGARSICAMKHLGLMYAGDPISTIPYVGTVGGMVVVSAGDPSCHTSPNEQDQRHLGPMLHIPVLDPSTPQEAHAMTRMAFDLSERSRLPVLLRITTRVAHTRAVVRCGELAKPRVTGFVRDPQRFVPIPANARKLRLQIAERLETARGITAELFRRTGSARQAIITAGSPAATCADLLREHGLEDKVILAKLGAVYPLPEAELLELLRSVDRVLVVEELSPFLEDAVRNLAARHDLRPEILGKRSGHLPVEFEYDPVVIRRGIHAGLGLGSPPEPAAELSPVPQRPPTLCPGCPHRATYFVARAVFSPEETFFFNDIGCYTLGYGPPLETVDALLSMGAGFTLAAGVSRVTGRRTVGFLGDSTFFHSGMPALLNAAKENANMVAVIMDNKVTAMTGFQESPTTVVGDRPSGEVPIAEVARALGVRHVETVNPADLPAAIAAFERARDAEGLSVIVTEAPCPMHMARETGHLPKIVPYEIDPVRCQTCGREGSGLRCGQGVMERFERNMARARAVGIVTEETPIEVGRAAAARPAAKRHAKPPSAPERPAVPRSVAERSAVAPCAARCPLGLCIQGYTGQIAARQYREALELIVSRTPLPETVCRVCHRPCEEACVYGKSYEPVAINDLKRFVIDWAASQETFPYDPPRQEPNGKRVAVVGAGPAGLAAAHDLRLRGYDVTLFDANQKPGGLLLTGIPRFRLPLETLRRDVGRIIGLGVEFVGDTVLGKDIHLQDLLARGYDAIFLGLGASLSLPLPEIGEVGGDRKPSVIDALSYLARSRQEAPPEGGHRVVVVGGGNAAIDSARTALRRGAERVVVAYRRRRAEMPAINEEIEAAVREGVELLLQVQPVTLRRGARPGLVCVRTEPGEADPSGRSRPVPVTGSDALIEADEVIVAIGQAVDPSFQERAPRKPKGEAPRLELESDGSVRVDPTTAATSDPRIFAGGDVVSGARTVTEAIAWGQRAAWGIDRFLRGPEAADRMKPPPRPGTLDRLVKTGGARFVSPTGAERRARPAELPIERRARGFEEAVGALTETQARAEASRCAVCGLCGNCRACLDLFGCPAFHVEEGRIRIDPDLCDGCGVCAAFCPNSAIRPREAS